MERRLSRVTDPTAMPIYSHAHTVYGTDYMGQTQRTHRQGLEGEQCLPSSCSDMGLSRTTDLTNMSIYRHIWISSCPEPPIQPSDKASCIAAPLGLAKNVFAKCSMSRASGGSGYGVINSIDVRHEDVGGCDALWVCSCYFWCMTPSCDTSINYRH